MSEHALHTWEKEFRAAAQADELAIFRDHLERLELPDEPELLLEGTVRMVQMCLAYAGMDGRKEQFAEFLDMQKYDPREAGAARYAFTFDLHGKAFGRLLVETKVRTIDLADLFGALWIDFQIAGYRCFWISRTDWNELTTAEVQQLEEEVTNDLRFDYGEDEVAFWFDGLQDETYLLVTVQEVFDSERDDEENT